MYRRLWAAAGVRPEHIRGVRDLVQLPIMTKADLLAHPVEDHLRRGALRRRTEIRVTSGTTGGQLDIYMSRSELLVRRYILWKQMWRDANRVLPMTIVQAGSWVTPGPRGEIRSFRAYPLRFVHISRHLPIAEQVVALAGSHPTIITGCPSQLEIIATEASRLDIEGIHPEAVVTRGEILRPQTRQILEAFFRSKVVNYYSAEEIGLIAWECPEAHDIMHVQQDSCVVEILDEHGQRVPAGEEGDVVVSNLFNRTMPFIRYRIGDRSKQVSGPAIACSCRGVRQSIRAPLGRPDDFITLPNGERASPRIIDDIVYLACAAEGGHDGFYDSVRDYQIIQQTPARIVVNVLTGQSVPDSASIALRNHVRAVHPELECCFQRVAAIEPEASGKRKRVISLVEPKAEETDR